MIRPDRKRKLTGVVLILIGVLFLLVSNNIWLGWANVWPLFPILGGMLFLSVYTRNKTPEMLFGGVTALLMGIFLLLFSLNIFPWSRMETLWPVIPAIGGIGLLAVTSAYHRSAGSLVAGVIFILFAFLGVLQESGVINQRVVAPFVRLWPLVLVVAGATLLKTRSAEEDADMKAVRQVMEPETDAATPDQSQASPSESPPETAAPVKGKEQ
jgi:hypothetical protein